ncbi:MAG: choice-of-anchor U domain-containing protein, partial [Thiogranum sp.]
LENDVAETVFGFRTTTGGDLINFFIKTGGGFSPLEGRFYLDDIYLETTDDTNLSNPLGGVDSNGDGISDADAIALGLDPNDPDGDTDNDGDSDVLETGSDPDNPLPVDSDGDGVIDALEPGNSATDASVASGLRLSSGDTVTITAAGQALSQVSASAVTGGPIGINFPFGSVSYTTTSPVGGSVTARLAFSADLPDLLGLYKEDNGVFTELPTSIWTLVDPATLDITLTDGDPLTDLDGRAGFIEDPVAPAELVPLAGNSSSSSGGCALNTAAQREPDPIFPLLMLAAFGYWFRRRWS